MRSRKIKDIIKRTYSIPGQRIPLGAAGYCAGRQTVYNGCMVAQGSEKPKKGVSKVKNFFLIILFLLVPLAGAFHPKLRRKEDPEGKEIGTAK
jgi:hypothetical protein